MVVIFGGMDRNYLFKVDGLKFDSTQLFDVILNIWKIGNIFVGFKFCGAKTNHQTNSV